MPDPCTQSNYLDVAIKHSAFSLHIDFDRKIISGSVKHQLHIRKSVNIVQLDTSYLDIQSIKLEGKECRYSLAQRHPVMGSRLDIHLSQSASKDSQILLEIQYATTAQCSALGWLEKEQTSDGTHPFVYSQCEAIHARSLYPCQDTPAIKARYSASCTSSVKGCTILMSARRDESTEGVFNFHQRVPVPSYLLAIAAGRLEYAQLGERTGVWAEPSVIKAAAWEFDGLEKVLTIGERLFGPYEYGVYDVVTMPKSFPFGGMENSNATFLTPTLLAGDRSLVDVAYHEFAHSYFGNLVSPQDWTCFYLNEGWTTYAERLILREVEGEASRAFSFIIGDKALRESLAQMSGTPKYTRLQIPLNEGEDPDDAFSSIPYNKGSQLLLLIERAVGGLDVFMPYIKNYVKTFRNQSIGTEDWRKHLFSFYESQPEITKKLNAIDWDAWLNGEGSELPVKLDVDTSLADKAYELAERWNKSRGSTSQFKQSDLADLNALQIVTFLEKLETYEPFTENDIGAMDHAYGFDKSGATEIRLRWYNVCLKPESGGKFKQSAADWVADKGRMKFCRPTYRNLYKLDPKLARKTFKSHADFYHPIARQLITKDLQL